MSACYAVVLDCKTEVAYFPFHGVRTAEEAEEKASSYIDDVVSVVGTEESNRFHLRVVSPKVVFRLVSGDLVECDLFNVDIDEPVCIDFDCHVSAFGYHRGLRHCGHWDLDRAEVVEFIA